MRQIEIRVTSRKFTIVFFPSLQEQMSVFAMNGFGDLQSFCEIREADLDYMGIMAPEQRAKILAAVQVMHDYQCKYEMMVFIVAQTYNIPKMERKTAL